MTVWIFSLISGLVQGVAEFLPVSSSGHLALLEAFFPEGSGSIGDLTAFNVLLHLGTLAAVLIVCRQDAQNLLRAAIALPGRFFAAVKSRAAPEPLSGYGRVGLYVLTATLPLVFVKLLDLLCEKLCGVGPLSLMEEHVTRRPEVVGAILVFNGLMLFLSEKLPKGQKTAESLGARRSLLIGVWQMFALLPGLSRSGSTIVAGRLCGLSREESVRFSFLLSVPAVLGSAVSELPGLFSGASDSRAALWPMAVSALVSFIAGFFSVKLLKKAAAGPAFGFFSLYCLAAGVAAITAAVLLS